MGTYVATYIISYQSFRNYLNFTLKNNTYAMIINDVLWPIHSRVPKSRLAEKNIVNQIKFNVGTMQLTKVSTYMIKL